MRRWRSIGLLVGAVALGFAGLRLRPQSSHHVHAFKLKEGWLLHLSLEQQGVDIQAHATRSRIVSENEAASAHKLCQIDYLRGYAREALDCYDRAYRTWGTLHDRSRQGIVRIDQGTLFATLGELPRALESYAQGLDHLRDADDRDDRNDHDDRMARSVALIQLGNTYYRLDVPRRALIQFQEALGLAKETGDRESQAVILNGMGLSWQKGGELDPASVAFRRALGIFEALGDIPGQATVWTNLGWLRLARKETLPALAAFQKALELSGASGNRAALAAAYAGMARAELARGDRNAARDRIERALRVAESLRSDTGRDFDSPSRPTDGGFMVDLLKASFQESRQEDYELLIDLLMQSGDTAAALEANERSRAGSLADNLKGINFKGINFEGIDLGGIESGTLTLSEIQTSVLDEESVLLEYALGEERSFLWWVTDDDYGHVELPGRGVLGEAARRLQAAMKRSHVPGGLLRARRQASKLSDLLLGPVADRILGKRWLLIVAPDILHSVAFEALPDPSGDDEERAWPRPLIAGSAVVRIPSASVLKHLRDRRERRPAPSLLLAAVGDPVSSDSDGRLPRSAARFGDAEGRLPRLPDAGREVADMLRLVRAADPEAEVVSATGFGASRDTVLESWKDALGSSSVAHLAAHGLLDAERPERSALLLSRFDRQGRHREGRLTAGDIRGLRLSNDLVVLSACQTALGRELRGEAPMGLAHAFLSAGASGVVVSLWNVDDRATAILMERFYRGLFAGGLPPAEALRQAQLALWRGPRWSAPFYWAGFVVEGDGLNQIRSGGSP